MSRIAACVLAGAFCTACTVGVRGTPGTVPPQAQSQAVAESVAVPAGAPVAVPVGAPVAATSHESAETLPLQSVYYVVAGNPKNGGRVEGYNRGVAFSYERDGSDCVLVTASHVVQGSGEINVYQLMPDLEYGTGYQAHVKWIDTTRDVAALRIRNSAACDPVLRYGTTVPLGRRVAAFLNTTLSRGMITSGIVGGHWRTEVGPTIVSDMRVYPGHSGSPLLDLQGRLIGMVLSRTQSLEMSAAFALPTSTIEAAFSAQSTRSSSLSPIIAVPP